MNAPTLTADLRRQLAQADTKILRLRVELAGARQVIEATRTRAGAR